jgi:tetratricopeptide (TPR) repeat protein
MLRMPGSAIISWLAARVNGRGHRRATVSKDWGYSPDYSPAAMADFEKRLSRARPGDRAQDLRVKAVVLSGLHDAGADSVAIELLLRIINEHAEVWYEVNFAHEELGSIYERMGRFEDAEREYRWVVKSYEKSRSGTSGVCELTLAELIINTRQSGKFLEAVDLITQAGKAKAISFRSDWFRYWLAAARLAHLIGKDNDAADFAQKALDLAAAKELQYPRHPTVGNVKLDTATQSELQSLAAHH